jgi:ElaA protein
MQVHWLLKSFPQLTTVELYALLRLRNEVFIVEQNCPFSDLDGKDQQCHHLLGFDEAGDELLAYTRLVPPGVSYGYPSIGRVVTALNARRFGKGRELMQRSIVEINRLYGATAIQIGAQVYLRNFYESFGFRQAGDSYLEDGIDHIPMIRQPN